MAPLFAHLNAEQARLYALVLASSGIRHALDHQEARWSIQVPAEERRRALRAIAAYRSENAAPPEALPSLASEPIRTFSAVYAAFILAAVHLAVGADREQQALFAAFDANAHLIMNGQIYRCLTALLLHADWPHLLANVAGTLLFGTYAVALYGWGVSWLLIIASGALGNLLTAWWYAGGHAAIGASTAVFAALGLCAAMSLWRRMALRGSGWRRWAPLAGGLALVGWLGTAPRSDLLAHLLGFSVGLLCGSLYARACGRIFPWPVQVAALLVVVVGIVAGWYQGMAYSG
jgi:membrane associated rhomboid family serine protease